MRNHNPLMRREGIVFGKGEHLPDANDLFDYRQHRLGDSEVVAALPGQPEYILRYHRLVRDPNEYLERVRHGIRHYKQMGKYGLVVRPQRFVMGPSFRTPGLDALYSFTDRLYGRDLTNSPADGRLSVPVIDGVARYVLWAWRSGQKEYLEEMTMPKQHTVLDQPPKDGPQTVVHDTGLDRNGYLHGVFSSKQHGLRESGDSLAEWAVNAETELPDSVRALQKLPESLGARIMHKLVGNS